MPRKDANGGEAGVWHPVVPGQAQNPLYTLGTNAYVCISLSINKNLGRNNLHVSKSVLCSNKYGHQFDSTHRFFREEGGLLSLEVTRAEAGALAP
jgi:hypothetical protein